MFINWDPGTKNEVVLFALITVSRLSQNVEGMEFMMGKRNQDLPTMKHQ